MLSVISRPKHDAVDKAPPVASVLQGISRSARDGASDPGGTSGEVSVCPVRG